MPKRYFKYYLTAITVISFIACSEKDTLNGEGMLHLKVGVTDQVKVTTRSMTGITGFFTTPLHNQHP